MSFSSMIGLLTTKRLFVYILLALIVITLGALVVIQTHTFATIGQGLAWLQNDPWGH